MTQTKGYETQESKIYEWLATGHKITPLQALRKFGCLRLSARIYNIRKFVDIETKHITRNGKTFAEYRMVNNETI